MNYPLEDNYHCTLSQETQELARRELQEDGKKRKKALTEMRRWIKTQPHFRKVRMDSNFLLRFLRMQKFEVKSSCEILDKYLTMRSQHPAWFQNLDCRDPKLAELIDMGYVIALPDRDAHGRRVIYSKGGVFDSSRFNAGDMMRAHILTFETLLNSEEDQVRGFTYVMDEKCVTWNQLSIWTPTEITKAFGCCEGALPMRHKEIHLLHLPWTLNLVFQFAKSLLSEKLRKRFASHSTVESLGRMVDLKVLPKENGGQRPLEECVRLWKKELEAHRTSVTALDEMRISEFEPVTDQVRQVRKKSKHHNGSVCDMLGVVNSVRKMEVQID